MKLKLPARDTKIAEHLTNTNKASQQLTKGQPITKKTHNELIELAQTLRTGSLAQQPNLGGIYS